MSWIKDNFFGGAAKDAAGVQIESLEKAMGIQRQAVDDAKQNILQMFAPAYGDLISGFQSAQDQIAQGRASTADIYNSATGQANQLMQQGTNASISALLGRNVSTGNAPMQQVQQTPTSQMNIQSGLRSQIQQKSPIQQPINQTGLPQRQELTNLQTAGTGAANPLDAMAAGSQPDRFADIRQGQSLGGLRGGDIRDIAINPRMGIGGAGSTGNYIAPGGRTTTTPTGAGQYTGGVVNRPMDQGQGQSQLPVDAEYMNQQNLSATNLPSLNMQGAPSIQTPDVSGIGLAGAEQALMGGAQGAEQALQGGLRGATNIFQQGMQGQLETLGQGFNQARGDLTQAQQGANQLFNQAIDQTGQAGQQAISQVQQGSQAATGRLDPYSQAGQQALQREAAMSGALGADAQAQAYGDFSESPAQKFMRERQEQALLRNAAAIGGLRSGSTLTALQEQAAGIAAQQEQRYLDNLRSLAGRGQQAAGSQAGIDMQSGLATSGITQDTAGRQSSLLGQQAGMGAQFGQGLSALSAGQGQAGANVIGQTASNIGQAQLGTGQQLSGLRQGLGQQLGSLRMGVGQQVAGQLSNLGQGMAQNQLNLGQQLGNLDQTTISNLANLLQNQGQQGFASRMQLAQLLANLATGQGTNLANLQSQIGSAAAGGITGGAAGAQQGVGTVAGLISAFGGGGL